MRLQILIRRIFQTSFTGKRRMSIQNHHIKISVTLAKKNTERGQRMIFSLYNHWAGSTSLCVSGKWVPVYFSCDCPLIYLNVLSELQMSTSSSIIPVSRHMFIIKHSKHNIKKYFNIFTCQLSFAQSFTYSLTHQTKKLNPSLGSPIDSPTHSFTHAPNHPLTYPFIHPLICSLTHTHTHTHSLTHSLKQEFFFSFQKISFSLAISF